MMRRARWSMMVALALSPLLACESHTPDPASDSSFGASPSGDAALAEDARAPEETTKSDAATANDGGSRDATRDEIPPDAGSRDAGAAGRTCGGISGASCSPAQFCNYEPPNGQGCDGTIADAAGVCEAKPQACTEQYDPVCGCDGNTYSNACAAHAAGASVASRGACAPRKVSCDARPLLCGRADPVCPDGQVPSVVGSCFGPCVAIEQCTCREAAECPYEDRYTCHLSRGVCGPYLR